MDVGLIILLPVRSVSCRTDIIFPDDFLPKFIIESLCYFTVLATMSFLVLILLFTRCPHY